MNMKATHFEEQIAFYGPTGMSTAITAAALRDHMTKSEFLRGVVLAHLREHGVPLDPQPRQTESAT
jgi:hypothetical protein